MSPSVGEIYGGDVLGFLVPTNVIRLGRQYFAAVSAAFTAGDISESGIYVGLPLALIVARYTITRWRLTSTRFYTAMLAVVIVLLLGSHLHIAGHATIPLPWKQLGHSLLRDVLPVRLGLYMLLIVALITAAWLAQRRAGWLRAAKWVAAAVSVAFLLPNFGSGLWHWAPPNPAFFTTHQYRTALKRGETALVVPFGPTGLSMLWQAETGMWFRMAGGYLAPSPPTDYQRDPLLPALSGEDQPQPAVLRSFLARRRIGAIILGPGAPSSWPPVLAALGLKPIALGGITLYQTSKTFTTGSVIGSHE